MSAVFSADGTQLLTVSGGAAEIRKATSGRGIARFGHNEPVRSASFSIDGTRVVTASRDKTARVWDTVSGAELARLNHDDRIESAAFTAEGKRVITASHDNTARIWDTESGIEIARFNHNSAVTDVNFSANGAGMITASAGKTARVWDVTWASMLTDDLLVRAVARERNAGRLTEEELRILRPILGQIDADVTSRWLGSSPDDAEIEAILALWRGNREMALALAKKDWTSCAEELRADLSQRRDAGGSGVAPSATGSKPEAHPPISHSSPILPRKAEETPGGPFSPSSPRPDQVPNGEDSPVEPGSGHAFARRWLARAVLAVIAALAAVATRSAGLWP